MNDPMIRLACSRRISRYNFRQRKLGRFGLAAHDRVTIAIMKEPGLDGRHRDKDGEIDRKRSDTRVDTLRKTYGDDFLPDFRGDAHLGTVLDETGANSLTELVKEHRRKK